MSTLHAALAALRDRFCDCPGQGLPDDQHSPDGCHGLEVVRAIRPILAAFPAPAESSEGLSEEERVAICRPLWESGCHGFVDDHPGLFAAVERILSARLAARQPVGETRVESVITGENSAGVRDVDIRHIMRDEEYDAFEDAVGIVAIRFLGIAIGQYLASVTGLPIDFQFQQQTAANENHGDLRRNPLGVRSMGNFVGDGERLSRSSKAGGGDE